MRRFLLSVFRWMLLLVSLFPIFLCFGIFANDVSSFFHNLVVLTVAEAVVGFVAFMVAHVMD